jgi:23S rRNA G2445 N2-methylase RlmL
MSQTEKEDRLPAKSRIVITCGRGIAPFLKEEVLHMGFQVLSETASSIETEGSFRDTYRLNLRLRTGHRVLFLIDEFSAGDAEELYRKVSGMAWENFIDEDGYVCVTSNVENPTIRDSRYANVKCKDAIVDRIKMIRGRRPDSGPKKDRTVINLYWKDEGCALYFDTSGEPLSRRGYRKIPLAAPMQETLAAAVVIATGWSGEGNFVNPMCGSGTIAIEAALLALDKAPGLLRGNFGFMHVKGFRKDLWDKIRDEARRDVRKVVKGRIIATDIGKEAIAAAKKNAETAGVLQTIDFSVSDFAETTVPPGGGVAIMNPEYGERMGKIADLGNVYESIGDFFKQRCEGYRGYIFTGTPALAKKVGLRSKRRIPFFNSGIECRLLEYLNPRFSNTVSERACMGATKA